jgi:hypothetical protein
VDIKIVCSHCGYVMEKAVGPTADLYEAALKAAVARMEENKILYPVTPGDYPEVNRINSERYIAEAEFAALYERLKEVGK